MKRIICVFMVLLTMICFCTSATAAEADPSLMKEIRVGYFDLRNCMEKTKDGTLRSGYTYDLLREIATVSKWEIKYVDGDFDVLLEMLQQGQIDVLPSVAYSDERTQNMLFSDMNIVEERTYIFAKPHTTRENIPQIPVDINGATVATVEGTYQDILLQQWESENEVKTIHVYCESFEKAWEMLESGESDYAVNLDYTAPNNLFIPLFSLGSNSSHFAVAKERTDIIADINNAIVRINQVSPYLISRLGEKYLKHGISAVQISEEEYTWLEKHPIIRIGAYTNDYPLSFIDEKGNKVGVYRDLNDMIFAAAGLDIQYEWILFDTIQQAHEALSNGYLDIFCEDYHNYGIAEQNGLIISDPVNEVAMGLMSLAERGTVPNQKIAVAQTRLGEFYAREVYPDAELILCDTVPECVEKVASGEAGYCIAHTSVLHQFSSGYKQAFSMSPLNFSCFVCYSATKENPEIISIINRGLNLINQIERNTMEMRYTTTEAYGGYLVKNFIRDNLWLLIGIGAFLLVIAVVAINRIVYTHKLKGDFNEIKRLRDEQQKNSELLADTLNQAQAANRAKTTFLNNISHDIRTPMNAIIGYTGLASSHIDNTEQVRSYLAKISQSSEHLLSLINDVLDMSRIESGKVSINEQEEDLSEILHMLRNIVQSDINSKQFDFFIDTDVTDQFVVCDKLRLNQILLNVLSNSIKYTRPGGTISVRVKETGLTESGYGKYEFRIKDNGMGMSEEYLKTIFDPFTREKSSTISGIQGTGLGMAITKNIVDMMGGTIEIMSKEREGTETVLNFVFKQTGGNKKPIQIERLQGLKGLVVDDDIDACQNIARMLRDIGMRSEWCTSGKEAVIRTQEAVELGDLFKVYIIDWIMPDMNGIETTRRIRKAVGDEAPIIVLTAYDWSDIEAEAREAGVTAFVSKPMFPSDLHSVLNKCCGGEECVKAEPEKGYEFSGKKILLVEDNEMNREIAKEILEEEGCIIDTAEDGTIAVERMKHAKHGQYDLILMDVQMPLMNGYDATKAIRALPDPEIANITIVAMTANAFEEDRQEALRAGMNEHLKKPIEIEKLKETLAKFMT